jgi:hypothetical protein
MERLRMMLSVLALILAAFFASSCGTGPSALPCNANSQTPAQGQGQLQAITLSPAVADAQNCPSGQIQFIATGVYIDPTQTVTPQLVAAWGACQQDVPTSDVSVTTKGVAQCASGATGTYTIWANYPTNPFCNVVGPCGQGCTVVGTAQLTCP